LRVKDPPCHLAQGPLQSSTIRTVSPLGLTAHRAAGLLESGRLASLGYRHHDGEGSVARAGFQSRIRILGLGLGEDPVDGRQAEAGSGAISLGGVERLKRACLDDVGGSCRCRCRLTRSRTFCPQRDFDPPGHGVGVHGDGCRYRWSACRHRWAWHRGALEREGSPATCLQLARGRPGPGRRSPASGDHEARCAQAEGPAQAFSSTAVMTLVEVEDLRLDYHPGGRTRAADG